MKTGASDSAWLRAVLDEVGGDTARLLLVSQDKDVTAAFTEWKKACPLMRHRSELKATMSEFTVDQGRAEHLISQYLTDSLKDSLEDEEALHFDIDAAANLERAIASSLEENEPDTGLYGASLTRLTGLAGITGTYVESHPAEVESQPRTSELGPASAQTALATVFFLANALWGFRTRPLVLTWALCGSLVFADEATEDMPSLDSFLGEVGGGWSGRGGWSERLR